jgi:predicted amidohydrolase YtcJ
LWSHKRVTRIKPVGRNSGWRAFRNRNGNARHRLAATTEAARDLAAEGEIGTVEVGKWGDLVLLDADPLEDIRNTRRIWKVMQDGRVVGWRDPAYATSLP